jgi:hypothetical protein
LMSHGAAMSARLWSARASFRRSWSFIAMRARNRSRRSFVRLIPTASSQPSLHRRGEERTRRAKEDGRRMGRDEPGRVGREEGTQGQRKGGRWGGGKDAQVSIVVRSLSMNGFPVCSKSSCSAYRHHSDSSYSSSHSSGLVA